MRPLVPSHIERVAPYIAGKDEATLRRERGIEQVIKLASNECPLGPSPKVIEALPGLLSELHRYPDPNAHALREALSQQLGVGYDEICLGHGSNEVIDLICRVFVTPEDHALVGTPSFICYANGLRANNVPFTEVALRGGSQWSVGDLLEAVRSDTKLLFLASPNNPTGTYLGRAELTRLLCELPPSVVVVMDEAYIEFVDAPDYVSALELRSLRERLIVLRTFSKAYGLAALRVGFGVGPAAIISYLQRVRAPFNVGTLGQAAACIALGDRPHLEQYLALNRSERTRVSTELNALGLAVVPSQANFVYLQYEQPAAYETYEALLTQGLAVRPLGPHGLRISIGLPEQNDALLAAMKGLAAMKKVTCT